MKSRSCMLAFALTVMASWSAQAGNIGNCQQFPDISQGVYWGQASLYADPLATGKPNMYCAQAYGGTSLEACQAAYGGLLSLLPKLDDNVSVTVATEPAAVGQWGTCFPVGQVNWLSSSLTCPVPPLTPLTDPDAISF